MLVLRELHCMRDPTTIARYANLLSRRFFPMESMSARGAGARSAEPMHALCIAVAIAGDPPL